MNTSTVLIIAGIGIAAYLILKPKTANAQPISGYMPFNFVWQGKDGATATITQDSNGNLVDGTHSNWTYV